MRLSFFRERSPAWAILICLILFYCLDYYFRISPSLVVMPLMHQYQTTTLGIGAFASIFYLGYLLFQIPAGIMLDRWPFRRLMIPIILVCTGCFIAFICTHHYWLGYLLRFLVGATSAFSFISVLYFTRTYLPARWFSFITGLTVAAGTLSASVAQVVSAKAMQYFSWHQVLIFLSLWGIVVAILLSLPRFALKKSHITTPNTPNASAIFSQLLQLLKNKRLVANALIGGLFYLPTTLFASLWGIPFLQSVYQLSITQASTGITCLFAGWAIGAPLVGLAADKIAFPQRLISGFGAAAGIISVFLLYTPHLVGLGVFTLLFLFGLFSSAQVIIWKIFDKHCPPSQIGLGTSVTNMLIMLFGVVFHLLVGWLLSTGILYTARGHINFSVGLAILPLVFFIVVVLNGLLSRRN